MVQILKILGDLSLALGFPVLTPEYEIALALVDRAELTADQLIECSSLSRAGFFNTIDRLKARGVVTFRPSDTDRRYKLYRLDKGVHASILTRFAEYQLTYEGRRTSNSPIEYMANVNNSARRARLLSHLSCEYQIALYLFIYDGMSNSALRRLVDASGTTFSVALRNLRSRGAIYFKVDPDDRRRKLYYVSDKIRVIMEKAHQEVFIWLDLVARRDTKSRRLSSEQPPL